MTSKKEIEMILGGPRRDFLLVLDRSIMLQRVLMQERGGSRREEAQASAAGEGAAARGCCRRGCCRRWRCLAETMTPKSTLWDNMAPEAFGVAYQKSLGLALGSSQLRQGQNESVSVSQG